MPQIESTVSSQRTIFRNSGFLVAQVREVRVTGLGGLGVVVFYGQVPTDGELQTPLTIVGEWTTSPKHGSRFQVSDWRPVLELSSPGVIPDAASLKPQAPQRSEPQVPVPKPEKGRRPEHATADKGSDLSWYHGAGDTLPF